MLFYFAPLVVLCLLAVSATLIRPRLIYEYPYFMAATFAVFILPQAYALYRNEWGGIYLQTTLLMCSLSLAACWIGYRAKPHPGLLEKLNVSVDTSRFLLGGILLVIVGAYFTYKFGTIQEENSEDARTGISTIFLFFGGLVYPGFAICFYCALRDRLIVAWITAALAAIIPFQAAVYYGRREPTVLFLLSLGLSLYFIKALRPPRILVFGAIVGAMFFIPATSEYRSRAKEDPLGALAEIDFAEQLQSSMEEDAISELKNATALIAATQATGGYQYGADYWNALVFRFVPAQFVGKGLKESLMFGGVQRDFGEYVERVLGFPLPTGTTVTGIGDSFNQFGYFGCLVFALLGYFFKSLWAAANQPKAIVAQVLYIQVVTSAMRALTHETIDFLPGFIYSAVFIGAIAWFARERTAPHPVILSMPRAHSTPTLPR